MSKKIDNYLTMVILRSVYASKEILNIIKEYIYYRFEINDKLLIKEIEDGFVIYRVDEDTNDLYIISVRRCESDSKFFIKVKYYNAAEKESIDEFRIYSSGLMGYLKDTLLIGQSLHTIETYYKDDIVIPNSLDKSNIVWLEDNSIYEIFKFGLESHRIMVSEEKQDTLRLK